MQWVEGAGCPREYGLAKTFYNHWKRWNDKGVIVAKMNGLSAKGTGRKTLMTDATYLKVTSSRFLPPV